MKNNNTILIVIMFLLSFPTLTSAQLIKIGAGGGITQVLAPELYTDDVAGGFGYTTEWNAGIIGKVDLPMISFTPRAYILYHIFSGNSSGGPELWKIMAEDGIETSQSVLEMGAGIQYNFIPAPLGFDPYIALDLSYNSFGEVTSKYSGQEYKTDGFNRFGGGLGVGTEISIIPVVNLDLYLSYKMFNLTGKEDGEETVSAVTLDAFIIFNFL
jgi:hypothetical protein